MGVLAVKNYGSLSIMALVISACTYQATCPVILESTFIRIVDGFPIDGRTLFDCAYLIKKMREISYGKITNQQTKEREGLYLFRSKKYGLDQLAELEKQYAKDQQAQQELRVVLAQVKKDFCILNLPFLDKIKAHKTPIMKLMLESCTKRSIPNSFMLRWADTPSGKEDESFNSSMTSFGELSKFIHELCNFMSDLFGSCPKARRQYDELIKRQQRTDKLD